MLKETVFSAAAAHRPGTELISVKIRAVKILFLLFTGNSK
jgi:hypothetical protein